MDKERLLAWLRERMDEGEYATAETFLNDVFGRADEYDSYRESAEARMREYEEQHEGFAREIENLKARNYDLLMKVPTEANSGDGVVEEVVTDEGEVMHIDNLFIDPDTEERY